jgi:hypothetical protein
VATASRPSWHQSNDNLWHETNEALNLKNVKAACATRLNARSIVTVGIFVTIFATNSLVAAA